LSPRFPKLANAHEELSSSLKKTVQAYLKKSAEFLVDGDKVFGPVTSQAITIKNEQALLLKLQWKVMTLMN